MKKHILKANSRKTTGRKVKKLRKLGLLPGNVYGKKIKSFAVEVDSKEFNKIYKEAGETGIVDLTIDGKVVPVLIHKIQYHPVEETLLHVDLYQVNLKEKVTATVSVELRGEAEAVKNKVGALLTLISHIEVEALPADLPEKIEIEISNLKTLGDSVKISDIKISEKIKILVEKDLDVVKVVPLVSKEAEKMAAEAAAAAAAAATASIAEGETAASEVAKKVEGEKPESGTEQKTS
jgi:large subunit ribosomal protein L25